MTCEAHSTENLFVVGHIGATIRACTKGRADQKALRQTRPGAFPSLMYLFRNTFPVCTLTPEL